MPLKNAKLCPLKDPLFCLAILVGIIASPSQRSGWEGLNAAEFKFFNESDAPYICNDCFAIEIGNSRYNYLYALTRLRQVNIINIIKLCRQSTHLCPLYSA